MEGSDSNSLRALGRVGKTLRGKWHLERLLGVGGVGAVYEATHRNGFRAAVKVLHASLAQDASTRRRFLREARLSNRLRHPNVPFFFDDDEDEDGTPYLVMELLEGETIEARLRRRGPVEPMAALRIADAVLSVLEVAHRKGVLHRDIKPQNVLLTRQGQTKLLDFGLARAPRTPRSSMPGHTALTTAVVGTPAYMAPEQLRGELEAVDERTDLWAVGALVFTLLTDRWPQQLTPLVMTSGDRELPSLKSLLPSAPPSLVELVDRALRSNAAERWPTARAMRSALRQAHRELKAAAVVVPPAPRSRSPWLAAAAAVGALAIAAVAFAARAWTPAASPSTAPTAPSAASVSVLLQVMPASAALYLDGERLPTNPYRGWMPRDDQQHEFRAIAPNHVPKARLLSFRRDVEVDLHLEPLAEPPAHPAP